MFRDPIHALGGVRISSTGCRAPLLSPLVNWIRIAVGIGDDPDIYLLAERLNVSPHEAIGLVVLLLVRFPEHAETGDLSNIPDALLERWAGWTGERGAFAQAVRAIFLKGAGLAELWPQLLILSGMAVVVMVVAVRRFGRTMG